MTALELRTEIHKVIDNVPETLLPEILQHINAMQQSSSENDDLTKFIDKVFKEDDGLLRRLAQ